MSGSATNNTIVVTGEPRGRRLGCLISGTPSPGAIMEITAATAMVNGLFTYEAAATPFGPIAVLEEDWTQGKTVGDAYAAGAYGRLYFPLPGDELLVRAADAAYTIGQPLLVSSGAVAASVGTSGQFQFVSLEAVTNPGLLLVMFSGN